MIELEPQSLPHRYVGQDTISRLAWARRPQSPWVLPPRTRCLGTNPRLIACSTIFSGCQVRNSRTVPAVRRPGCPRTAARKPSSLPCYTGPAGPPACCHRPTPVSVATTRPIKRWTACLSIRPTERSARRFRPVAANRGTAGESFVGQITLSKQTESFRRDLESAKRSQLEPTACTTIQQTSNEDR